MSNLKTESLNKCFSLLREFIDESGDETRKGRAALALEQLRRITAGKEKDADQPVPGLDSLALLGGDRCLTKPRGDESPGDPIGF